MANEAGFAGSIPIAINHTPRPYARDVSFDSDRPTNVVAAEAKNIKTQGRLKPTGSITWSIPNHKHPTAAQFLDEAQRLEASGDDFTLEYRIAGGTFMLLECSLSKVSINSNQDGQADMTWQFAATEKVGPV